MKKGYIIEAQTTWSARYFDEKRMTVIYLDPEQAIKEALIIVEDENKGIQKRIDEEKAKDWYDEEFPMHSLLEEKELSESDNWDYKPKIYKQWKTSSEWEPDYVKVLEFDII